MPHVETSRSPPGLLVVGLKIPVAAAITRAHARPRRPVVIPVVLRRRPIFPNPYLFLLYRSNVTRSGLFLHTQPTSCLSFLARVRYWIWLSVANPVKESVFGFVVDGYQLGALVFAPPYSVIVIRVIHVDSVAFSSVSNPVLWARPHPSLYALVATVAILGLCVARGIPAEAEGVSMTIDERSGCAARAIRHNPCRRCNRRRRSRRRRRWLGRRCWRWRCNHQKRGRDRRRRRGARTP